MAAKTGNNDVPVRWLQVVYFGVLSILSSRNLSHSYYVSLPNGRFSWVAWFWQCCSSQNKQERSILPFSFVQLAIPSIFGNHAPTREVPHSLNGRGFVNSFYIVPNLCRKYPKLSDKSWKRLTLGDCWMSATCKWKVYNYALPPSPPSLLWHMCKVHHASKNELICMNAQPDTCIYMNRLYNVESSGSRLLLTAQSESFKFCGFHISYIKIQERDIIKRSLYTWGHRELNPLFRYIRIYLKSGVNSLRAQVCTDRFIIYLSWILL